MRPLDPPLRSPGARAPERMGENMPAQPAARAQSATPGSWPVDSGAPRGPGGWPGDRAADTHADGLRPDPNMGPDMGYGPDGGTGARGGPAARAPAAAPAHGRPQAYAAPHPGTRTTSWTADDRGAGGYDSAGGDSAGYGADGFAGDDLRQDWQSGAARADDLIPPAAAAATFYDAHIQRLRGPSTPPVAPSPAASRPDGAQAAGGPVAGLYPVSQPGGAGRGRGPGAADGTGAMPAGTGESLHPDQAAARTAAAIARQVSGQGAVKGAGQGAALRGTASPPPPAFLRRAPRNAGRDPAPSRLTYRLQRLWLTPLFRRVLGVGLPMAVIAFSVITVLSDPARHAALMAMYDDLYTAFQDRPEFRIETVEVQGASPEVAHAIRTQLATLLPDSSLRLDLEAQRGWIEALDAIASAEMHVLAGGTLEVRVTERVPAIIWRSAEGLELLDRSGTRVAMLRSRAGRPDLPVIAGAGASDHVPEALTLIATASPLADRLRGLVRVGQRRWDVVLDRDQRILLPETGARAALERTLALHQAQDLLARDVALVDLRTPARPTLRLAEGALTTLYSIRNQ